MLEPPEQYQTSGTLQDIDTIIPCDMDRQSEHDVTVVDALASSRMSQNSMCNHNC